MGTTSLSLTEEKLKESFYQLKTRKDVEKLLEISSSQLTYHLYIYPLVEAYTTFEVPKKSGGFRLISAPKTSLKIIQHKLNQVLKSVYQPTQSTHGFITDRSIITNAKQHLRQRYVLNIDLKDFFPSINFGRVRGIFLSPPYNCTKKVATVLSQICCYDNQLPQGAPTSPIVSNMICAKLDFQLQKLAKKYQCIYTRYADDITFSTSKQSFPSQLAWFSGESGKIVVGSHLEKVIEDNGFIINDLKVRLQRKDEHQEVTGITVNEKLNVKQKYIRQVRAMLHSWEKNGLENAEAEFWRKFNEKHHLHTIPTSFRDIIRGKIEFIGAVRGDGDRIYLKYLTWLKKLAPDLVNDKKWNDVVAQNLLLEQQRILPLPMIWCEGKTDIKHLKSALEWLRKNGTNYKFKLEFKEDLNQQTQGSSELLKMCKQFRMVRQNQPIIAIFDRDESGIIKDIDDDSNGFKKWGNGVYSFAIPLPKHRLDKNGVCIELYYQDSEIQREDKSGRRLFLSNEFNHMSGKHNNLKSLNISNVDKIKGDQLKIVDDRVFDESDNNVALSKSDFADNVFNSIEGFNDFDFGAFKEIFEVIKKILEYHSENPT